MRKISIVLSQAQAFAERDLRIFFRFKVGAIANVFVPAIVSIGLFGTVFLGFFNSGFTGASGLNKENFISFTLLGALVSTLYAQAQGAMSGRFAIEKYWQTIPALLASPLSRWAMLLGVVLSDIAKFSLVAGIFLALAYLFWPVSALVIVTVMVLLVLLYSLISGISLIRGAVFLVNENLDPILNYFLLITGFVSCFYYPVTFLPSFVQWLAYINPIYFVVYLIRASWLGQPFDVSYAFLAIVATIVSCSVGVISFNKIWRNSDITGY
ncbi:MAG: ABC transporter permease [Nitrososphaerales archaeon]